MQAKSKRVTFTLIVTVIFVIIISVFVIFGTQLRDFFSPKVMYIYPDERSVKGEIFMLYSVPNDALHYDESGSPYILVISEDEYTGEHRYYAQKQSLDIIKTDGDYSLTRRFMSTSKVIVSSDREVSANQRVVPLGEIKSEKEW